MYVRCHLSHAEAPHHALAESISAITPAATATIQSCLGARGHAARASASEASPCVKMFIVISLSRAQQRYQTQLPDRQRLIVGLRDIEGLSGREVCELLELSQENQRVLLHRGRSRLRAVLDGYIDGADT